MMPRTLLSALLALGFASRLTAADRRSSSTATSGRSCPTTAYACHGPDARARKADLRLDTKDGLADETVVVPGQSGEERSGPADHRGRPGRGHAAAEVGQEAHPEADRDPQEVDRPGGEVRGPLGVRADQAAARRPPAAKHPVDAFIRRRTEQAEAQAVARGRPGHADPPAVVRPDRPAADAGGGGRLRQRHRRRTPTRSSSIGCSPRRTTASGWRCSGWTWCATPTPSATTATNRCSVWPYRDWVIRGVQRQHAVRPVHRRATGRRPAAEPDASSRRSRPGTTGSA